MPVEIRETTKRILAGEEATKADLLNSAEWWCRHADEDNVVTDLILLELCTAREPPTPHEQKQIEDERATAIYHLKTELPALVPEEIR